MYHDIKTRSFSFVLRARAVGTAVLLVIGLIVLTGCPTPISDQAADQLGAAAEENAAGGSTAGAAAANGSESGADDNGAPGQSDGSQPQAPSDDDPPAAGQAEPKIGDMNGDGVIDAADVEAFTMAMAQFEGYGAAYPDGDPMLADCNGDGVLTLFDIDCFAALLESAG